MDTPTLSLSRRHLVKSFGAFCVVSQGSLAFSSAWASDRVASVRTIYRMAQFDDHDLDGRANATELMTLVREQIDIVYAVKLPRRMLDAILHVPVIISSTASSNDYSQGVIRIDPTSLSSDKPILLHEYLHALHDRVLPDGFDNAQIKAFYLEARARQMFPPDAYLFKNIIEFFARTASAVLYGRIQRDPFTRERVRLAMPAYYSWLESLFEAKGRWT